ncbi:hypothetical protein ACLKA7_006843 [Drosophila subpalustris]
MAKLSDTKIPITDFLESYRRQPCLYNSLLDTYKNRVAREEAYEAIIKSLKIPHLTVLDIKLKIKSVRTVYTKELRILMREKELGRCYEPKLFWFKRADSFLRSVSLSHCKRLKNKIGDAENTSVAIKKEAPQKILLTASTGLIEDALQDQEQEPEEEEEDDESETGERLHDDGHGNKLHASTATHTNNNKTELVIDDSSISITDQQQQQQAAQRKLKYMPYVHQLQSQHQQQQQQRLSTPFASPSPSSQQLNDLSTPINAALCFTTPNGSVNNSNDDDLIIFGQSIASQLRSIPDPYSRSLAKLRIQQVLFEAETGQNSETVSPHLHSF